MTAPPAQPNPADVRRRREFARTHIADAAARGPVPIYGSRAWHRLPYADPRRWAAVLVAAEAWALDGDDIPGRLRRELAAAAAAEQQVDADEFAGMAAGVRADARRPSYAVLQHRRGELTDDQLADHQAAAAAFTAGRTDHPPRLPRPGAA